MNLWRWENKMILTKEFKKKFKEQLHIFAKSFWYNLFNGGGVSLLGFLATQLFWLPFLVIFTGLFWNYLEYLGVTAITDFEFKLSSYRMINLRKFKRIVIYVSLP